MPTLNIPPAIGSASKIVISCPITAKSLPAASPEGPAPIMATFFFLPVFFLLKSLFGYSFSAKSAATLLSEQIDTGSSILPLRQALSHGCVHTLPRI